MSTFSAIVVLWTIIILMLSFVSSQSPSFKVVAFYKANDPNETAHASFVHEANIWFPQVAKENNFQYDSTNDWTNLNNDFLSRYNVVIFLDNRPGEETTQRYAFEKFMENGGGFIGFHYAGFALNDSAVPQNWTWYHDHFLGSGQYVSNTWRPTAAVLFVEDPLHPATKNFPNSFISAPNEWYRWERDLRENDDIHVLLSIDHCSFPLGTVPDQTWYSGYYPVVWTNIQYHMLYINMGHNDLDSEGKELSFTFANVRQNQLILNAVLWLGGVTSNLGMNLMSEI